ncbi:MAG: Concanavalin A-like lectin/glucanase superfamily, partial [Planctomycetota bacterium]
DRSGSGFRYLVSHGGVAATNRLGIYFDQNVGTLRTALIYANDLTTLDALDVTRDLRDGTWHHYGLTATTDGLVRVYIDGVEATSAMYLGDVLDPSGDLTLGVRSDLGTGTFAACALADLRLYDRELAAVELALLARPAEREEAVYPGTDEGLVLATGVGGPPTSGVGADVRPIAGGQGAWVAYSTSDPARLGRVAALLAEVRATGAPVIHPVFAGLHVLQPIVAHGPVTLSSAGATWLWPAPPGFAGLSVMLQAVALDPTAANGLFVASDAHELRLQ